MSTVYTYSQHTHTHTTTTVTTFSESIQEENGTETTSERERKKGERKSKLFWSLVDCSSVLLTDMIFPVACKVALHKVLILDSNLILHLDSIRPFAYFFLQSFVTGRYLTGTHVCRYTWRLKIELPISFRL